MYWRRVLFGKGMGHPYPFDSVIRIVQSDRKGMLGRQPVVDIEDSYFQVGADKLTHDLLGVETSKTVAPAVKDDDQGKTISWTSVWCVDSNGDLCAIPCRDLIVLLCPRGWDAGTQGLKHCWTGCKAFTASRPCFTIPVDVFPSG